MHQLFMNKTLKIQCYLINQSIILPYKLKKIHLKKINILKRREKNKITYRRIAPLIWNIINAQKIKKKKKERQSTTTAENNYSRVSSNQELPYHNRGSLISRIAIDTNHRAGIGVELMNMVGLLLKNLIILSHKVRTNLQNPNHTENTLFLYIRFNDNRKSYTIVDISMNFPLNLT